MQVDTEVISESSEASFGDNGVNIGESDQGHLQYPPHPFSSIFSGCDVADDNDHDSYDSDDSVDSDLADAGNDGEIERTNSTDLNHSILRWILITFFNIIEYLTMLLQQFFPFFHLCLVC